ncbi:hypothetical protein GCM10010431_79620 [Streptomyces kunmingensis]
MEYVYEAANSAAAAARMKMSTHAGRNGDFLYEAQRSAPLGGRPCSPWGGCGRGCSGSDKEDMSER